MNQYLAACVYFGVLTISLVVSLLQRVHLSAGDRWIGNLLIVTLLAESTAQVAIATLQNNMYVYHVWSPIELLIICVYFRLQVEMLRVYYVCEIIAGFGFFLALVNALFWQPIDTINSIFLLYEGFCIIALSLFAFYRLVLTEQEILRNTHFWVTTIFLVYWSVVFVYWGMYPFFLSSREQLDIMTYSLWVTNIIAYSGFGVVFIFYKKMISAGG